MPQMDRLHQPVAVRQARLSLALLLAINLFNYIDRYVLAALEPRIQQTLFPNRPVNDPHVLAMMGSLATAFIVSYMVMAPIFGWLADRMSRWLLIGISVILWSLATGGSGLAPTFAILLLTRLFVGVGEAGYGPAAPSLIADFFPIARRGSAMAWCYMAIPVGSALGYTLGGKIGSIFGWREAFLLVAPPGLLLGLVCFLCKTPRRGASDDANAPPAAARWADYLPLLRTPSYLLDTAGMAAVTFAIGGISYWMPHYIGEVRHAGELGQVNLIFGIITVLAGLSATYLGGLAGDLLRPRFGGSYFLVSGIGILLSCPLILLMLAVPFPWAWGVIFAAEFCLFFNTGPSNTILANVTHPSIRATAFALNILIIHALGDGPSPPILGNIAGQFGWNAAFGLITAITALGGVFWLIGVRFLPADTEAVPRRINSSIKSA